MTSLSAALAATTGREPDPGRKPDSLNTSAVTLALPLSSAVDSTPGTPTVALLVFAVVVCAVSAAWSRRGDRDRRG